jgi:multisubunit Na+/H+ antiporter MnhC subunit
MVILAIIAMPIVGFFLATSKDQNKHVLGWILVAVGIILWIAVFSG